MPPLSLSARSNRTDDSPITYYVRLAVENPRLVSLAAGLVDEATLPVSEVANALAAILADPASGRAALQYGTTAGYLPLREQVLARLASDDGTSPQALGLTADDVVITTGSQQFLDLVSTALLDPGDIVITEGPSYFVYHGVLASLGARVLTVPMDEHGLDVDALEAIVAGLAAEGQLHRLKLVYTCDYFQNPTGLTLAADRRRRVLEVVREASRDHRVLLLEDAAYRQLRYEGDDVPSIKSLDVGNEHVIWTGTFSKPCAPGLKTGYGIVPRDLMPSVLRLKSNCDFGSTNLVQHAVSRLVADGTYDRHVLRLCDAYRAKRDALLSALDEEFADEPGVTWTRPAGGLYVYVTFPSGTDTGRDGELLPAALREGVLYIPGELGHVGGPTNEVRLSFGVASPGQLREGVRRLRRAYQSVGTRVRVPASV